MADIMDKKENATSASAATVLPEEGYKCVKTADGPAPKNRFVTKDIVMCVVVLVGIALVAGVLLGVMNWVTYVDPDASIIGEVASYYSVSSDLVVKSEDRIINADGSKDVVLGCYTVKNAAGEDVSYVYYTSGSGGKSSTLELLVHISAEGVITDIEEYSQSETAGYFKKVMDANKGKYVGFDVTTIDGFELNGEGDNGIDAVSNATKTSTGINNAVNAAVYAFNHYSGVAE